MNPPDTAGQRPPGRAPKHRTLRSLVCLALLVVACGETDVAEQPEQARAPGAAAERHWPHAYHETGRPVGDQLYDLAECPLHLTALESAQVQVLNGLPYLAPADYHEVRERDFPYARGLIMGGCTGRLESLQVDRCPACTEAEQAWLAAGD